ncbi:MAG TPA: hypothetical protein VE546_06545 [Streptomyces sp.]|uniref:hypothetical protein n=1 Tax=Streptomyces sp. TaxID=1931 RepID=UPI002D2597D0|nr:hypothetical protein [Streptomyces sp.]HZG03213.1 hypothetical protein [Streptomyces sp.]
MGNFFMTGELHADRLAAALAEIFRVAPGDVEVVDEEAAPEGRNWDALVFCEYAAVRGQVSWALDVYARDTMTEQPDEAELARRLAAKLRCVVLYPAAETPPSAYWLVTPDGLVTRARLYESDNEESLYSIDAVEDPVPQLPDVRVELMREVIRKQFVPTPVFEEFSRAVEEQLKSRTEKIGEAAPLDLEPGSLLWYAGNALGAWEKSVHRVENDWRPGGRYPADMYVEDLRTRDRIAELSDALPQEFRDVLRDSVDDLDECFRRATRDDGGAALGKVLGVSRIAMMDKGWWWHRRPVRLPWEGL